MSSWFESPLVRAIVLALAAAGVIMVLLGGSNERTFSTWQPNGTGGGAAPALVGRGQQAPADGDKPWGNPLNNPATVMTQGYGVGSHAPAATWGAVDLAISVNGRATPDATLGAPVYATHAGTVRITPNSYPAGNHVWVLGERYKTGYAHLQGFAPELQTGQTVQRGQLIGFVGSTGVSSGPHLDYQVWQDGVNVNPLDFGALDGAGR